MDQWGRPDAMDFADLAMKTVSTFAGIQQTQERAANMKDKADYNTYMTNYLKDESWADKITPEDQSINGGMLAKAQQDHLTLKTAKMDFHIKQMHQTYESLYENSLNAFNGMEAARNTDGSVKDVKAYQYHYAKLLEGYDLLNTQWDITHDNKGKKRIDFENGTMQVIDHTTGEVTQMKIPTESEAKGYLGRYFDMSSYQPEKKSEGMKKLITDTLVNEAKIKEQNRKSRESAVEYKNPKTGERILKFDVRDPNLGGYKKTLYQNISKPGVDFHDEEGEKYIKENGFVTREEEKKDLDISLKKAQISTEEKRSDFYSGGKADSAAKKRMKEIQSEHPDWSPDQVESQYQYEVNRKASFTQRLNKFYESIDPNKNYEAPDPSEDPEAAEKFAKEQANKFGDDVYKVAIEGAKKSPDITVTGGIADKAKSKAKESALKLSQAAPPKGWEQDAFVGTVQVGKDKGKKGWFAKRDGKTLFLGLIK